MPELTVNKIKFKTFKHLKVNDKIIDDKELLKGFELISEEVQAKIVKNDFELSDFSKQGAWKISQGNFIVEKGDVIEGGFTVKADAPHAHKLKIELKEGARAKLYFLYDLDESDLIGDIEFILDKDARLEFAPIFLGGKKVIYNMRADLDNSGASMHMEGAYYCGDGSDYDLNTEVNHNAPYTNGLINMNGVLDDGSKKTYKYCIDFPSGSFKAKGEENEVVVAVGEDFNNSTVPILLVGEDTIEAVHGATLQRPSLEILDYIMSRGIEQKTAEFMCVEAQFAEALEMMDIDTRQSTQLRLEEIIRGREACFIYKI
ncbi:MAG: SufD family Fe-S cluster assembly protein [Ezakiella sp.]|nr:SufD family Fe-S cluster assembly protein [Ezakiella sp.]MDD7761389.1 SufD family Fe-S cluster assembly protein [Bacillota bacterium]MDY3946923.1 SufD family Fe-S cluster assembly protein [Ezakiella sp.]